MIPDQSYSMTPVGWINSPYKEKFAIPRQPGLVNACVSTITLAKHCNREEILRGLSGFSHVWVLFVFHQAIRENWKPMVRPPRLGGNQKVGVFASRSPFRPNPIGLSVVELKGIRQTDGQWLLDIGGADLLDQTPVLDIKPYVPYVDAVAEAKGHYAEKSPDMDTHIVFSDLALNQLDHLESQYLNLKLLIEQVLSQQPQPAYQNTDNRDYGVSLYDLNVRWRVEQSTFYVTNIARH